MFSHLLVTCFDPRVSPPESSETGVDQRPCAKFTAFNLVGHGQLRRDFSKGIPRDHQKRDDWDD